MKDLTVADDARRQLTGDGSPAAAAPVVIAVVWSETPWPSV